MVRVRGWRGVGRWGGWAVRGGAGRCGAGLGGAGGRVQWGTRGSRDASL